MDAVVITTATSSNSPIELAADVCRQRGRIVLVGVAGTELPRQPFFEKELEFTVSHSLGPGRSERAYEGKGLDGPIGYARWTAQRNMEAVLETIAGGAPRSTNYDPPVPDRSRGRRLRSVVSSREPFLGVLIQHDQAASPACRVRCGAGQSIRDGCGRHRIGNFARLVALPHSVCCRFRLRGVCSARASTLSSWDGKVSLSPQPIRQRFWPIRKRLYSS